MFTGARTVTTNPSMLVKIGSKVLVLKGAPVTTAVNQQLDAPPCFRYCRAEKNAAEGAAAGAGA